MIFKINKEGENLRVLLPKPDQRRKRVKVVIGKWEDAKSLAKDNNVLVFTEPHDLKSIEYKNAFLIKGPGHYEVKGIFFKAFHSEKVGLIHALWGEEEKMAFLSCPEDLEKEVDVDILDEMGSISLLVLDLDWGNLPKPKNLKSVISQIDPSAIVFMDGGSEIDDLLKKMDIKNFEREDEISFDRFNEDKKTYYVIEGE